MKYLALTPEGIYDLGDHGDFQAADETAESLQLEIIWVFDEPMADEYLNRLAYILGRKPVEIY